MLMTIFDLSFAAIPDLEKQAEDIDFFFIEYIRYMFLFLLSLALKCFLHHTF